MLVKGGFNSYGESIGILLLETRFPRVPGDIGNATTFDFPVRYKVVRGATVERVLDMSDQRRLLMLFIEAAKELEKEGVKCVTTSCGFLSIFQNEVAEALEVPVFTSSLMQVHLVSSMLGKNQKVGIVTANKKKLTKKHLEAVGIKDIPFCIAGMEEQENFRDLILKEGLTGDINKVEIEMVKVSKELLKQNPEVGAIVLECVNMPPFSAAIQKALNLPVFDIISLVNYVHDALIKKKYTGIFL